VGRDCLTSIPRCNRTIWVLRRRFIPDAHLCLPESCLMCFGYATVHVTRSAQQRRFGDRPMNPIVPEVSWTSMIGKVHGTRVFAKLPVSTLSLKAYRTPFLRSAAQEQRETLWKFVAHDNCLCEFHSVLQFAAFIQFCPTRISNVKEVIPDNDSMRRITAGRGRLFNHFC
jgi:hypothetical protein